MQQSEEIIQKTFEGIEPVIMKKGNEILRHLATEEIPKPFVLTSFLRETYSILWEYFSGKDSFLNRGKNFNFSKGLLVCGGVGTGKTLMMEIYSALIYRQAKKAQLKAFVIEDSHRIVREFLLDGFETIEKYSSRHYYFRHGIPQGLCIDDLGMEDMNAKSYGNSANVIEQILYERYKRMRTDGMITHATTNCPSSELGKLYGARVADRMMEMFNIVVMDGKSMRV